MNRLKLLEIVVTFLRQKVSDLIQKVQLQEAHNIRTEQQMKELEQKSQEVFTILMFMINDPMFIYYHH